MSAWYFVPPMLAATSLLLVAEKRRSQRGKWIFKPIAAALFVLAGLSLGALGSLYGKLLLLGLIFSVGGDLLLIPKDKRAFLGGLVSFLLGHVAYAVAFAARGFAWTPTLIALGLSLLPFLIIARWLLPHVGPKMKAPVLAYMVAITIMLSLSVGTVAARGEAMIFVGAFGFYLSDLSVARDRFVAPGFNNRLWGMPLYFFAQLILASTAGAG